MEKLRKIILLLVAFTCFQSILASEIKEINCIDNTKIFNEGFEVEQLLNSNSQVNIGFIDKIADWIAGWWPNWEFWQKAVGTGAGHYIEKDGIEITYPITLYDKTEFDSYDAFRNKIITKLSNNYFKGIYLDIYSKANAATTMTCTEELNGICDVATRAKLAAFCYFMQLKVDPGENIIDCMRGESEMDNFLSIALNALNTMNTDVPIIINENRDYVQWRCKELILYVQAYDFLKGAGVGDTELETAKENIKQLTAEVYRRGKYWYFYYDNNFSLMLAGSIGLSAIVLNGVQLRFVPPTID